MDPQEPTPQVQGMREGRGRMSNSFNHRPLPEAKMPGWGGWGHMTVDEEHLTEQEERSMAVGTHRPGLKPWPSQLGV